MRIKNLTMAALVLAGGLGAGAATAKYFAPLNDVRLAHAAARCMGWKPQGLPQEVPVLRTGMPAQSYRFVRLTTWGGCATRWTRDIRAAQRFSLDTPVTVFKGSGTASYVLIRTSEGSGLYTYMGTIDFGEAPRTAKASYINCSSRGFRIVCSR